MLNKVVSLKLPAIIDIHSHCFTGKQTPFSDLGDIAASRKWDGLVNKLIDIFTGKEKERRIQDFLTDFKQDEQLFIIRRQYEAYQALGLVDGENALAERVVFAEMLMDFDQAGFKSFTKAEENFNKQLMAAYNMAQLFTAQGKLEVLPAAGIDPRDKNFKQTIKNHFDLGFNLFKLYPALGFALDDPILMKSFYSEIIKRGGAIICHCSPGGFQTMENPVRVYDYKKNKYEKKKFSDVFFMKVFDKPDKRDWFNHPKNWQRVLRLLSERFARGNELFVDLAHFGGGSNIKKYLSGKGSDSYTEKIIELCLSSDYPNIYADISSAIGRGELLNEFLEFIISKYPGIENKILFGTDNYILRSSADLSITLKTFFDYWTKNNPAYLRKFVYENPLRFMQRI